MKKDNTDNTDNLIVPLTKGMVKNVTKLMAEYSKLKEENAALLEEIEFLQNFNDELVERLDFINGASSLEFAGGERYDDEEIDKQNNE